MADVVEEKMKPDLERSRFPHCVVWTPIPVLTWLFPFIGHMGICTSSGVIRDFAGPYYVYWQLDPNLVYANGPNPWDTAVNEASEEYKHRMHNLCCDNCHSHVAMALNLMKYNNTNWNMVKLCILSLVYSKYVRLPEDLGPLPLVDRDSYRNCAHFTSAVKFVTDSPIINQLDSIRYLDSRRN
ncbi:hypothetical protein AB205_0004150 [Aquarana catesbeiana]|uniref:Transmembrane protein 222 n=1 Tax=Aquarana catesbeiana TaxID=8400 RepID=A0A2G9RAR1_AQUCT|nr:hypothetical protein AB205_0004150 [Aquarana catesbeiana]